ncbi:hypothetical protein SAMN05216525_101594 [Bradyrhizobium sp. Gha]|nr:hypothetical protein SAMN05216525_101594 [Bradyrhizobium sp. Gha]
MINPNCRVCEGQGWVCEKHPQKAWTRTGCQCAPVARCECQVALAKTTRLVATEA